MPKIDLSASRAVPILQVAEALDIEVFRGNKMRCPCPGRHQSDYTRPTMTIDARRNRVKCWACGVSGSPIDLVQWCRGISVVEAAKFVLALEHGQARASDQSKPSLTTAPEFPGRPGTDADVRVFADLMAACVRAETIPELRDYIAHRLPPAWETFSQVGLRAVADPEAVTLIMRSRHSEEQLVSSGVINKKGRLRFWHHRLILFFLKTDRRPYYFQARRQGAGEPRFLSPTGIETPCLMGQVALRGLRPWSDVYLVEGQFDMLTLAALGLPTVGLPGTDFARDDLLRVLRKYRVRLVPQNDAAGRAMTAAVLRQLRRVTVIELPVEGADVNDHYRRMGEEALFDFVVPGERDR